MHICMHVHIGIYEHIFKFTSAYIHVGVCVHIHTHTHTHTHTYICIWIKFYMNNGALDYFACTLKPMALCP